MSITDFTTGYDAFVPHFDVTKFVLKYLGTVVFIANIVLWKLYRGEKWIRPENVDLTTGRS